MLRDQLLTEPVKQPASSTNNVTVYISNSVVEKARHRIIMSTLIRLALENISSLHGQHYLLVAVK